MYSPRQWIGLVFDVYSRHVLRKLLPLLSFFSIYSAVITYVTSTYAPNLELKALLPLHSLFGIILGLFLVFRTNSAYNKWWEGRKIWGIFGE